MLFLIFFTKIVMKVYTQFMKGIADDVLAYGIVVRIVVREETGNDI